MRIPTFARTIRFRLTLWYAAFLTLLITLILIGINLAMRQHLMSGVAPQVHLELLLNYSLISLGVVLLFGAVGGYFLSGRMLRPIDRVSSLAARISSTNLKERISYLGPNDEMKRLADTFDDMLRRLESAFESQKQFIQDASHELRTPIAIAQTNIEVTEMNKRVTNRDYKRLTEVLKLSLERMNSLSDKLLLLSEANQDQGKWSAVNMSTLIHEVTIEFNGRAKAAGLTLVIEPVPENMVVKGDDLGLKQVISNIVDNAIKYNRQGGTVKISAQVEDYQLTLLVQDTGIGISKVDQHQIFDRFYRVDKSRSRAQGGSGLGLAIVKKIVEAHGGTISVESTQDEGSTFRIFIPLHS